MRILILLSFICAIIFILYPEIDLWVVDKTYNSTKGFIWIDQYFFRLLYKSLYKIIPALLIILVGCLIYGYIFKRNSLTKNTLFLLLCLAIGPGLIVNLVLKENFGRARPAQIKQYNKEYSKIFYVSDQCESNCSFTSGHAAAGFYFSSFGWVVRKKYKNPIIILSIIFGLLLGLARILQGAHFLSDVIFSGLIVNIVNHLIAKRIFKY